MERITLRAATPDDMQALHRLYDEFHAFHVRGVPDRLLIPDEPRPIGEFVAAIEKILADAQAMLFVADDGGAIIGFAEMSLREQDASPWVPARRYGHLQSLAVTESMRRRGVGRLLLDAAEEWAVARGANEVRTDIWEFGEGPLSFYEGRGYRTLRRTLVRAVSS